MPVWRASICWFALLPFLWALSLPGKDGLALSVRNSVTLGYLCGVLWYFGNCFWIYQTMYLYGGLPKPVSLGIVVLFSLYLGLYHALFAGLFALALRRVEPLVAMGLAPFLWVAVELARGRITGFPWDLLGNVLVDDKGAIWIAPLAGVMGISFIVVAQNAILAGALVGKTRRYVLLGVCEVLLVAGLLLGKSLSGGEAPSAHQSAVLLQENLGVGAMRALDQPMSETDELALFANLSLAPKLVAGVAAEKPALVVWPEAPSHLQSNDPMVRDYLAHLAQTAQAPVIAGSLGVDPNPQVARGVSVYDSAALINANGTYAGRYDKIHLVPWGEYIPFKRFLSFAQKLTEGAGDMDAGQARSVFTTGGHTYGVFICYESIFGDEVRQFARNGAEVLVNISDDGWYGETGAPWQHLNMARMRAIENHRWVLRSTNTGVTTSIDPSGRVAVEAPRHVRAAFVFPFGFEQGTTFYTRHGDWFAYLCAVISVLVLAGLSVAKKPLLR